MKKSSFFSQTNKNDQNLNVLHITVKSLFAPTGAMTTTHHMLTWLAPFSHGASNIIQSTRYISQVQHHSGIIAIIHHFSKYKHWLGLDLLLLRFCHTFFARPRMSSAGETSEAKQDKQSLVRNAVRLNEAQRQFVRRQSFMNQVK